MQFFCSVYHALFVIYIATFLGLQRIGQSVLSVGAIFFASCLVTLEKEILVKLQKSWYTLQSPTAVVSKQSPTAMVSKQSIQSLQKVEPSSTLCSHCKPKEVARQVAKRACDTSNLSHNAIATQVTKKIAPCNTSCRAWFYFLQGF